MRSLPDRRACRWSRRPPRRRRSPRAAASPATSGTRPQRPSASRRIRGSAPSSATAIRSQITSGASLRPSTSRQSIEEGWGPVRSTPCTRSTRVLSGWATQRRSRRRPAERQRHAARAAAAAGQLGALDRDHGAVLGLAPVVEGEEVDRGDQPEARAPPARRASRRCAGSSRSCRAAPRGSCRPSSTAPAPGGCGCCRRRRSAPAAVPARSAAAKKFGISRTPSIALLAGAARRAARARRSTADRPRTARGPRG